MAIGLHTLVQLQETDCCRIHILKGIKEKLFSLLCDCMLLYIVQVYAMLNAYVFYTLELV